MNKKIRYAVRTYLIENGKVVAIEYQDHDIGYFDIPGGKIEEGETPEETSIREFKEETGMTILGQHCIGKCIVEYPNRIYDFKVFIVDSYQGEPQNFEQNKAMWINIENLYKEKKTMACIEAIKYFKENINIKIECDMNHNILNINTY